MRGNDTPMRVPIVGIKALSPEGLLESQKIEEFELIEEPDSEQSLCVGDVILAIRGTHAKSAVVQGKFSSATFASGNVAVIRPDTSKLSPNYLWAFLQGASHTQASFLIRRASTQQLTIRITDIADLQIPTLSLKEQEQIGSAALGLASAVAAARIAHEKGEIVFQNFVSRVLEIQ